MTSRSSLWFKHLLRTRTLAAALMVAAVISVIATYISITQNVGPKADNAKSIVALILVNLILLLALGALVARRAVRLWAALKEGSVGSRLQTRVVAIFTLITIIPTVIVSVFSALFFNFGIQSWFDERVSTALEESVLVAEAYLNEHKEIIRADALAMAGDIDHEVQNNLITPNFLNSIVNGQAALRSLTEAVILQRGHIIAQTQLSFSLVFERIAQELLQRADNGEVVLMVDDDDKVRALTKLRSLPDSYLVIGRFVDSKVAGHVDNAHGSIQQYRRLKENISGLQIQFFIVFVMLALLLLFAAVWYGMIFASNLIVPITKLVNAAERVRAGDYTVRVTEGPKDDEVGTLARAFNRMTDELQKQRKDLIEANRQLDTRRRFTETVLSGVSAGIIALSRDKQISLYNPMVAQLLFIPADMEIKNKSIEEIAPEFAALLAEAEEKSERITQGDVTITRNDQSHVLHVRVAAERMLESVEGYIVTFDDITQLVVAQRSAAWADVARRVAHEIKNPLTPIQLSAERLRKKYLPQITTDSENYLKYIDTISKHVGDIGKIVEEFVMFARMPTPVMKKEDILPIIRRATFSEQTTHPEITYQLQLPHTPITIYGDEEQISRVLLNLLKNAAEALEGSVQGVITVECTTENSQCKIRICDNGPGFPSDKMNRLLEPYVTTRAKGTGLGLAIVKKILDDHKAQLVLENVPEGGACIIITFPIDSDKNVT